MGAEAALACQKCDYWTCAGCSGSIAVEEGFTKVTPEEQYRADLEHRRSYEYKGTSKLTRGSLPSKSKPMFIRGFNCCVKVHCSTDDPSFRLCAVPIHEEPVFFKKSLARRSLRWCCYVAQFTAKIMFCFFSYELAVRAVLIYLLVSAALALEGASPLRRRWFDPVDKGVSRIGAERQPNRSEPLAKASHKKRAVATKELSIRAVYICISPLARDQRTSLAVRSVDAFDHFNELIKRKFICIIPHAIGNPIKRDPEAL